MFLHWWPLHDGWPVICHGLHFILHSLAWLTSRFAYMPVSINKSLAALFLLQHGLPFLPGRYLGVLQKFSESYITRLTICSTEVRRFQVQGLCLCWVKLEFTPTAPEVHTYTVYVHMYMYRISWVSHGGQSKATLVVKGSSKTVPEPSATHII